MHKSIHTKIVQKITDLLREADFFIVSLEWIEEKLREDPEITIQLSDQGLLDLVQGEKKFKLFESSHLELSPDITEIITSDELKKMGFSNSPRIMLQERVPSKTELLQFLMNKANQTFSTLKKAWDIRPANNQHIEDQLLQALAKSQKLQRELKAVFTEEEKKNNEVVV